MESMGLRSTLRTALGYPPRPDYLASPFSEAQLQQIVWSDIFDAALVPIGRTEAMGIPALTKARNLLTGTISKLPLKAADATGILPDDKQPRWTYRTDAEVSPFLRMTWTIDDLLFHGQCLWQVTRGSEGNILTADRCPYEWWKIDAEGAILIHDEPVSADDVIYFTGPTDALLDSHGTTLRSARSIAAAVEKRVKNPIPVAELKATEAAELTEAEAKNVIVEYNKARRDPEGATFYSPLGIELKTHGTDADAGFMVEGRNQVRLDIANITGIPAALLDGSTSSASLTYSTQEGRRNEFVDFSLSSWMEAIAGRLSADDVVPRGTRIVFDQSDFLTTTPSPTGPQKQD